MTLRITWKNAEEIMGIIGIDGLFNKDISKVKFKKTVKEACERKNGEELKENISKYTKMKALRDEIVKGNEYFFKLSLHDVRNIFKFRMEMYHSKMNFKQNAEFNKENYLCDSCETQTDENIHVLFCSSYQKLREGLDINNDSHVAWYLQQVLEIRTELRLNR